MSTQKISIERRKLNEGLAQDIKDIKDMLVNMQRMEAARAEREKTIREDLDRLKITVNGNGVPGLKTDVQIIKEQIKRVNWIVGSFSGAIIVWIVTQIFSK